MTLPIQHKARGLSPLSNDYAASQNFASVIFIFVQEKCRGDCPSGRYIPPDWISTASLLSTQRRSQGGVGCWPDPSFSPHIHSCSKAWACQRWWRV